MSEELSFCIPVPQEPKGKLVSAQEAEKILLEKLKERETDLEHAIWDLAVFYSRTNRQNIAIQYMNRLVANTDDPERKARYYLNLGQLMEQIKNYEAAMGFYLQAFSLEPANSFTWYFINNNLGYCLNHFGRHEEAESYCRAAIKMAPALHNAYKNLGISLEGQGHYKEAAKSYIKAVQANAGDPRALLHLEELVEKHKELLIDIPDLQSQIDKCKEAVDLARRIQQGFENRLTRKIDE